MTARNGFLNLCAVSQQTAEMAALVNSLTHGAGRCDAKSLNHVLRQPSGSDYEQTTIFNQIPSYCEAYFQHQYTNFKDSNVIPKYVGIPQRGGFWVEPSDYEQALSTYLQRIQAEDLAQRKFQEEGG